MRVRLQSDVSWTDDAVAFGPHTREKKKGDDDQSAKEMAIRLRI